MDHDLKVKVVVCASTLISCYLTMLNEEPRKRKKRKMWVKPWLENRLESGAYYAILIELKLHDFESFRRYLRMNTHTFEVGKDSDFAFMTIFHIICQFYLRFFIKNQ